MLDEITVTATRAERSIRDVPQTIHVVSREEIQTQLQQNSNPSAVLAKLIPGFSVSNQTISGASETFRGRDLLVMLDGVALNTPLRDVSRILSLIDLNAVERIEVVSGASSLYGSGATGGTVNLITRKPTDGKPTLTVNTAVRAFTKDVGGSLQPEASAALTGKMPNGFDYVVVGSGRFADKTYDGAGRELASDGMLGQGGGDRFSSGNALVKLGYDFDAAKRFEVSGTMIYLDQKPDWLTSYSRPFARPNFNAPYTSESVLENTQSFSARYTDTNFFLGQLKVLGFYNDVEKRFNYSVFDATYNNAVYYSGSVANPTASYNQTTLYSKRGGVNVTIDSSLDAIWTGAKLTWGGDATHENTTQTLTNGADVFNPLSQRSLAAFSQLQVPVGERLTVRGGARYEHLDLTVDNFNRPAVFFGVGNNYAVLPVLPVIGGEFTYAAPTFNLGGTYKLTESSEIYGGFSQGFALPDVGAFTRRAGASGLAQIMFYGCLNNPVCTKNLSASYSNIGPEAQIVNNYELGIRGQHGAFKANLVGFISKSKNGVSFDPTTNQITQQRETIYGTEFTGTWAATQSLTLGMTARYQEGRFDTNKDSALDSHLPNNRIGAPFRGTIYGDYLFDNGVAVRLEGEGFSGRNQPIDLAGTRYELHGAAIMNASISVPWQGATLYAGVNNLFDRAYENPTATSVRNLPVYAWGRTVSVGYRKTF